MFLTGSSDDLVMSCSGIRTITLSKRKKKVMVALEGNWKSISGTRKNRLSLLVSGFQILFLTC